MKKQNRRSRDAQLNDYYKRVARHAKRLIDFHPTELVMSGPTSAKKKVHNVLDYRLQALSAKFIDQEYSGYTGLLQTIRRLELS